MTSSDMCTMYGAGAVRTCTWLCCVREHSGPAPWLCCVRERSGPAFFTFASASWPQACTSHLGAATGGCALSHLAHPVYLCSHISLSLLLTCTDPWTVHLRYIHSTKYCFLYIYLSSEAYDPHSTFEIHSAILLITAELAFTGLTLQY